MLRDLSRTPPLCAGELRRAVRNALPSIDRGLLVLAQAEDLQSAAFLLEQATGRMPRILGPLSTERDRLSLVELLVQTTEPQVVLTTQPLQIPDRIALAMIWMALDATARGQS